MNENSRFWDVPGIPDGPCVPDVPGVLNVPFRVLDSAREKALNACRFKIKWTYFRVNGFEVGVNDSIFSGSEQQKVYYMIFTQDRHFRCSREREIVMGTDRFQNEMENSS